MEIIYKPNGNQLISSGMDDVEKLKSIAGITGTWGEEATEISFEDFKQIDLRLRGNTTNYKQHILTYNPIDSDHWIAQKYF
jgi:phage terminase large subunit